MAKNTGEGSRNGSVKDRVQTYNPSTKRWTKKNASTGVVLQVKKSPGAFKGVARDVDGRRK